MKITIPGKPKGKDRPRFGKNHVRSTEQTKAYEKLVAYSYISQKGLNFGSEPLNVTIDCFYQIPKNMPKYKRKIIKTGELRPVVKPDLDNIAKAVLDALNKVAYNDDNQIVGLCIQKFYSDNPRVEIEIVPFKHLNTDQLIKSNAAKINKLSEENKRLFVVREVERNKNQISIDEVL